ncbi:MAG TPA: SAM-dependent methyltransferase [Cytophagales bacterium]|jgi:SAM-dependent methyltransferase|nr:SAM-dependent methyltransferase [Cytophagales bacterium]
MTYSPKKQWYTSWFDTPYYHILYKDRDYAEAQIFMDNLTNYLNIPEDGSILDLACGRGRHAIYLNKLGYRVTGIDLSEQNIAHAKQYEKKDLTFEVHDMSTPFPGVFDAVFNLFTSFGYFEDDSANLKTIKSIKQELNPAGFGVIDFMNVPFVTDHLVPQNSKRVEGIDFNLKRHVEDGYIIKNISFSHQGKDFEFAERVKAFTLSDFEQLFQDAGVYLLDVFGDYHLGRYHPQNSQRLIMIFK